MRATEPFRFETRIRFIDTDASGRIHYTAMFRYFESAEIEFLRKLGVTYAAHGGYSFPRVHVECDFKVPIRHDDIIDIEVYLRNIGRSSARFEFRTLKSGELAAHGTVVVACVDSKTGRAIPIPEETRARLRTALVTGNGGEAHDEEG
ncbi:MAG: acyl-CoA thioesterase [Acidobacteriaceae bacterium]|nr:acyl-CoA thioesterase [Acidobacteriaceae bacterium]